MSGNVPFSSASRSGGVPSSSPQLTLSSHAFPPTISAEQQASLLAHTAAEKAAHAQAAQAALHYQRTYPGAAPFHYRPGDSTPEPDDSIPGFQPINIPQQQYSSSGRALSSRALVSSASSEHLASIGRGMTPPLDAGFMPGLSRNSSANGMYSTVGTPPLGLSSPNLIPQIRRMNSRGSSGAAGTSPNAGAGAAAGDALGISVRPSSSGSKRKSTTHALLDLAPPLPLGGSSRSRDTSPPPDADGAGSSTKKKSGGIRKSKSEVSLLTAAERKANRLKRKAELARVSRRKKKGHLQDMEGRIQELRESIAAMEGREPPPPLSTSGAAGAGAAASIVSPSASFANLALLSHSSSTGSMHSVRASSRQATKRSRKEDEGYAEEGQGSDDDDDESEEDEDDEDEDDGSDDSDADAGGAGGGDSPMPPGRPRLNPSISAPHLHLHNQHQRTPPPPQQQHGSTLMSRQVSANSSIHTPPPASAAAVYEEQFNVAAYLPAVSPCPLLSPLATSILACAGADRSCSLVQLHRFLQDALKSLDATAQLDPFEKLLRWVALQASTPQPAPGEAATPAAAAQASAWAFLAHQLELSPAQLGALRHSRQGTERLGLEIAALRAELVRISAAVRAYMSTLDSVQQQLGAVGMDAAQIAGLEQFVQANRDWIEAQRNPPPPPAPEPPAAHPPGLDSIGATAANATDEFLLHSALMGYDGGVGGGSLVGTGLLMDPLGRQDSNVSLGSMGLGLERREGGLLGSPLLSGPSSMMMPNGNGVIGDRSPLLQMQMHQPSMMVGLASPPDAMHQMANASSAIPDYMLGAPAVAPSATSSFLVDSSALVTDAELMFDEHDQ